MSSVSLDSPLDLRAWLRDAEVSKAPESSGIPVPQSRDLRDDGIRSGVQQGTFQPVSAERSGPVHPALGLREPPRSLQAVIDDVAEFTSTVPPQSPSEVFTIALERIDHPEEIAAVVHYFVSSAEPDERDTALDNLRYFINRRGPEDSKSAWLGAVAQAQAGTLTLPPELTEFSAEPRDGRILHRDVKGANLRKVVASLLEIANEDPKGYTHVYFFNGSVEITATRGDDLGELTQRAEDALAGVHHPQPDRAQEAREEAEANRREMKAHAELLAAYADQPPRSAQQIIDALSEFSLTVPATDLPVHQAASRLEHPEEIRIFAATYAALSPDAAAANLEYLLDVKAIRPGTASFWQDAVDAITAGTLEADKALLDYEAPQPGDTIRHRAINGRNTNDVAAKLAEMAKDDGFVHVYDFNGFGDMIARPGDSGGEVLTRWEEQRAAA